MDNGLIVPLLDGTYAKYDSEWNLIPEKSKENLIEEEIANVLISLSEN